MTEGQFSEIRFTSVLSIYTTTSPYIYECVHVCVFVCVWRHLPNVGLASLAHAAFLGDWCPTVGHIHISVAGLNSEFSFS